jgi:hypothetical protein
MSTFSGIGTTYLGWSDRRPDRTHTATKWAVLLFLPLVPLRRDTLRVARRRNVVGASRMLLTDYVILRQESPRPLEVARTYVVWWLPVAAFVGAAMAASAYVPEEKMFLFGLGGPLVMVTYIFVLGRRHERRLGVPIERG